MIRCSDVKSRLDIEDVARQYGLDVNKNHKACCPFHGDKHPSLSFKNQHYRCFSCGASGDAIDLARELLGLSLQETLLKLNEDFGLGLSEKRYTSKSVVSRAKKARDYRDYLNEKKAREIEDMTDEYRILYKAYVMTHDPGLKNRLDQLEHELDRRAINDR